MNLCLILKLVITDYVIKLVLQKGCVIKFYSLINRSNNFFDRPNNYQLYSNQPLF